MRLLQVSLRSLLLYSLILVLVSIPVSFFAITEILNEQVDESLALRSEQFIKHIRSFEYLDDLELDLRIWDQLSYDFEVQPLQQAGPETKYETVYMYDSLEHEQHPFRTLTSNVNIKNRPYVMIVRLSLVDNDQLVTALAIVQIVLVALLAAGLLLINRSLSRKLWKPFYDTLNQLKAYEVDKNESIQPKKTDIIEFDDLNKTVSHLTGRNRRIYLQQKEFIENASHELQTPLAIFQSKLDILMQNPSMNESAAGIIQELEETSQRMSRLNKNLLLLSKIDNEQFNDVEEVRLSDVAEKILANLKPFARLEDISIQSSLEPLVLNANKTLIEVLLSNLFHNAIRHTEFKGKVSIEIKERALIVSNTGVPLKMSNHKVFERFSKESKSEKSTGLGLAIAKKICDSNGYTIEYAFENSTHTFVVHF